MFYTCAIRFGEIRTKFLSEKLSIFLSYFLLHLPSEPTWIDGANIQGQDVNGEFSVAECFSILIPVGKKLPPSSSPPNVIGVIFFPSPSPVWGIISVRFHVPALVHINLYDVSYSYIHEFILMVYKQIPSIKIHIWDWEKWMIRVSTLLIYHNYWILQVYEPLESDSRGE